MLACSHENLPVLLRALRANLAKCAALAGVVAPGVLGRDTGARRCCAVSKVPSMLGRWA